MKSLLVAAFAVVLLQVAGCATIISGKTQTISVNSNVEGAEVMFNKQVLGKTPLVVKLKRGQEGMLSVKKEGYQPYQIAVNKKINTIFWVNILSGGLLGSSTDYSTGAMYEYEPSTYFASLKQLGAKTDDTWKAREMLRAYLLLNNEAIVRDLAEGSGENLQALLTHLSVSSEQRAETIARWQQNYRQSAEALEFAESILREIPTRTL